MQGHITKRTGPRGTVWTAVVDLPRDPVTGKRRQKRITAPTKREVEAQLAQVVTAVDNGGFTEADAKKLIMKDYLTRWLDAASSSMKPSSHRRYVEMSNRHFVPYFGRIHLAKVTPLDVQRFYADRLSAGLSPTTVNLLHNILHCALKQAVRWGLTNRNVADAVDPPRKVRAEKATWSAPGRSILCRVRSGRVFRAVEVSCLNWNAAG